jgi:8-oxo-dGTP pyrophosphatase MutT (NUDIX family)
MLGKWNGFGGKVEKGETTAQAAMRELLEESRLKTETVVQKGRLVFTLDTEPEILVSLL